MLEAWAESIFLKRACLSFASAAAAYFAAHSLPGVSHLAVAGVHVSITIDPKVFADWLGVFFIGIANGAHDWAADKWPKLGAVIGQAAAAPAAPQVPDPKP